MVRAMSTANFPPFSSILLDGNPLVSSCMLIISERIESKVTLTPLKFAGPSLHTSVTL